MDDASAVREGQHVEPVLPLERGERLVAGAHRDQAIPAFVIEEGVDFVGVERGGHDVARLHERDLEVGGRQGEEPLERLYRQPSHTWGEVHTNSVGPRTGCGKENRSSLYPRSSNVATSSRSSARRWWHAGRDAPRSGHVAAATARSVQGA